MARPRKVPAVLVEATIRENGKLAALPSDSARLGYFYICLGAAKLLRPVPDQFASRAHFREVAGRFARYLDAYLATGLLEEAPKLCPRCKVRWVVMPPARGVIVTHDWWEHQYDPAKLERQRAYDERQRDGISDGVSDAHSDGVSDASGVGLTVGLTSDCGAVSDGFPTGDSRGRGRDRVVNVERRTSNGESHGSTTAPGAVARAREETAQEEAARLADDGFADAVEPVEITT